MGNNPHLDHRDKQLFQTIEYQAGKFMDQAIADGYAGLASALANEGIRVELADDDTMRLPNGSLIRLGWTVTAVAPYGRKSHVLVPQHCYEDYIRDHGPTSIATFAAAFDIHAGTARRKLDGLMAQGKLVREGRSPWEESVYSLPPEDHNVDYPT